MLGCDGANSTVRDLVEIEMADLHFTERWLVVDVRAPRGLPTWDGVEQVCDPARAATFMHVTRDWYRWEFQLRDGEDEADLVEPRMLARLLRPWTAQDDLAGLEVVRSAVYTFRARVASAFRAGRAFLLGDAAHLTPPFIGQGLGAGLRDADNLSWKIAHVLGGRAEAELLDSYDAERRPHATAMVKKAVAIGWAMTGGQDAAAFARRVALAVACRSATFRELLASPSTPRLRGGALQSCRSRRRVPRDLRVGGLVANPVVDLEDGTTARLDDVLRRRPAVLTAAAPTPELLRLCRRQGLLLVRLVPGARAGRPRRVGGALGARRRRVRPGRPARGSGAHGRRPARPGRGVGLPPAAPAAHPLARPGGPPRRRRHPSPPPQPPPPRRHHLTHQPVSPKEIPCSRSCPSCWRRSA